MSIRRGFEQRIEALESAIGATDIGSAHSFLEDLSEEEWDAALNAPETLERVAIAKFPSDPRNACNADLYGALYVAMKPAAERLRAERGRIGKPLGPLSVGRFHHFRRVGPRDWVKAEGDDGIIYGN